MPYTRSLLLLAALTWTACATHPSGDPGAGRPPQPGGKGEIEPASGTEWYRKAVFYEVFVRSFQDSNGDGKGDLPGLISRLDYLNDGNPETQEDLGVDALWLMPVFASPSYHGYDVVDYERIHPDYGTLEDFERLCEEAHRRGMRVIIDFVVNHSGVQHPWFVESASSPNSPKRDWYVWGPRDPGWKKPWDMFSTSPTWHEKNGAYYYGVFWGGMPDLNMRTPALREEVKRLASLWLERGVDGFRLDAARYLIETGGGAGQYDTAETHAFWKELAAHVRQVKPDAVLVGENWSTTPIIATYYGATPGAAPGGDELSLNFNFPLSEQILAGLNADNAASIAAKLVEMGGVYPAGISDAPILTNHDMVRVATQLGRNGGREANAVALLLTLPGSPFLYYGEEVGMTNGTTPNDEAKRTPMPWDGTPKGGFTTGTPWFGFSPGHGSGANVAAQTGVAESLLSRYRKLIHLRRASEVLSRGGLQVLSATSGRAPALAFVRTLGDEQVLVVHNVTDSSVSVGPFNLPGSTAEVLFADRGAGTLTRTPDGWQASLSGRATGIWRLQP
ncbi:alpha-amylase family glycosyl hydrolase [Stigmatella sp. ncwal1]|uniref:Alpha-amylase family glycosyl hydrolase n=1 Tax=Stigmatella ashevillensis TaxID=2995309 RepID=A0ABT5DL63_9BACT|nr:alpha-amylase family glycosyl hydrolase [Stigmatella ashevillena]MDC0713101.1 alpha-amylase family glycosyl hydrolase [Stigmatella ashevillena]